MRALGVFILLVAGGVAALLAWSWFDSEYVIRHKDDVVAEKAPAPEPWFEVAEMTVTYGPREEALIERFEKMLDERLAAAQEADENRRQARIADSLAQRWDSFGYPASHLPKVATAVLDPQGQRLVETNEEIAALLGSYLLGPRQALEELLADPATGDQLWVVVVDVDDVRYVLPAQCCCEQLIVWQFKNRPPQRPAGITKPEPKRVVRPEPPAAPASPAPANKRPERPEPANVPMFCATCKKE